MVILIIFGGFMKKVKVVFLIVLVTFLFICIVSLYNHTICPFKDYDKDVLINPENHNLYYEQEVEKFYNLYVEYYKYETYNTNFYYKHGKNSLFSYIGLVYWYSMESYSYTISLGIDYEVIKNNLLTQIKFIKTPVGYNDYVYVDAFEINGSVYNEIYMKSELDDEEIYLQQPRAHSYWFSYNDNKKEISFSCIFHFEPINRKNKEDFSKWLSYQF